MPLDIVVTNAGRAALINADNTGTAPVAITAVGLSSTAVAPLPSLTALAGEFKRIGAVSGEVVADDTIHVSVMDTSADSYTLRSVGLYLADGTLFAIYGQAGPILEKTVSSDAALSLDVILADISAALLTFGDATFVNPPASETRQGVVEFATPAEARAGDALRALTPATARAVILEWLLAQDGAGSGLDADLLDGQHGSYYTDIVARLGFNPLNRAGDTMTGPLALSGIPTVNGHAANKQYVDSLTTAAALLAKLISADGAGSGLDADLLDGLQAAAFARADGSAPFTGSVRMTDPNAAFMKPAGTVPTLIHRHDGGNYYMLLSNAAAAINAAFNALRPFIINLSSGRVTIGNGLDVAGGMSYSGGNVWSAGNDGSGSGMDADLLDGFQASQLVKYTDFTSASDWVRLPNGLILQWGWNPNFPNQLVSTVTFPVTFPTTALMMLTSLGTALTMTQVRVTTGAQPISRSQGQIAISAASAGSIGAYWFAIGF